MSLVEIVRHELNASMASSEQRFNETSFVEGRIQSKCFAFVYKRTELDVVIFVSQHFCVTLALFRNNEL